MTNQSELREQVDKTFQLINVAPNSSNYLSYDERTPFVDDIVQLITTNYTPNTQVEQLKSRIAWLEGKVEGLKHD